MDVGAWPLWSTVAAILVEAGMAVYFWVERDRFRGGRWFTGAIVAALLAAVCYLGQLLATDRAAAVFWSQATGVVGLGALVGIFGFIAVYTHREWVLRSRWSCALAAALLAVFAVRLTNDLPGWPGVHRLWATGVSTSVRGGYRLVEVTPGPAWYVYTAVVTVTLLTIVAFVVEFTLRPSQRLSRRRNAVVAVGVSLPALAAVLGQAVAAGFELSVPGVALSLVTIAVALSRFETLEAAPIARAGVVDEIDGGVVVFDDRERIVDLTTRARDILDAPAAAPGDDLTAVLADRFDGFAPDSEDPTERLDGATHRTAGGDRHVETRVSTLTDRAGEELSHALLLYDVTGRERRERELRRKNELLDEFASVVSHDVATPLGVVENKARLVELTGDTEHVEDIYEATDRIEELVDDLLALARQGREVGETRPVNLDTATREAWQSVDGGRAQLTVADTTRVEASPERLRQLLENLLVNAVEHGTGTDGPPPATGGNATGDSVGRSPADPDEVETDMGASDRPADSSVANADPSVRIRVGGLADGDGFYVADDGPGIPAGERDEVFEQGYTTEEGGTGLGLAIARRIAQAHGWDIDVTGSDAEGARFEVRGVDPADKSP